MDDGKLIEQISTFPQLYAKTDGRFKNNRMKENAWLTISRIMEETPEACQHRWKLLRNKYTALRREIKNIPSGSGASLVSWPYFKMMGFLDKYLQTRRSYSNIATGKIVESEWIDMPQIEVDYVQENDIQVIQEYDSFYNESEDLENESLEINSNSDLTQKSASASTQRSASMKQPPLKRSNENIPRHTISQKKVKTSEDLTEQIGGCFETFNKVLEKNMTEHQPTPITNDEHFVKSLAADMSIFSKKDVIILKQKIYQVLSDHLATLNNDSM